MATAPSPPPAIPPAENVISSTTQPLPRDASISLLASEAEVEPALVIDELAPEASIGNGGVSELKEGNNTRPTATSNESDDRQQLHLAVSSSPTSSSPSQNGASRPKPERPTSIVPVFWQHTRQTSRISVTSLTPTATPSSNTHPHHHSSHTPRTPSTTGGITLTDNTCPSPTALSPSSPSSDSPQFHTPRSPLWARQVDIDSHVKIEGDVPGVGGYIVWLVKVHTLDGGGSIVLRKRYSEFEALRAQLAATFPRAGESLPGLPPKSVFYKFRASFLERRRVGLAYFLNCILLNPEFAGSPAVREFIFATD